MVVLLCTALVFPSNYSASKRGGMRVYRATMKFQIPYRDSSRWWDVSMMLRIEVSLLCAVPRLLPSPISRESLPFHFLIMLFFSSGHCFQVPKKPFGTSQTGLLSLRSCTSVPLLFPPTIVRLIPYQSRSVMITIPGTNQVLCSRSVNHNIISTRVRLRGTNCRRRSLLRLLLSRRCFIVGVVAASSRVVLACFGKGTC